MLSYGPLWIKFCVYPPQVLRLPPSRSLEVFGVCHPFVDYRQFPNWLARVRVMQPIKVSPRLRWQCKPVMLRSKTAPLSWLPSAKDMTRARSMRLIPSGGPSAPGRRLSLRPLGQGAAPVPSGDPYFMRVPAGALFYVVGVPPNFTATRAHRHTTRTTGCNFYSPCLMYM